LQAGCLPPQIHRQALVLWDKKNASSGCRSGGILPLADFGTVTLSGCAATLNGLTGTISDPSWQYDAIVMAYPDSTVKAQPSALSGGGTSFSVTWQHE